MSLLTFLIAIGYIPGIASYASAGRWALIAIGGSVLLWGIRVQFGPGHLLGAFLIAYCAESVLWSFAPLDTIGQTLQMLFLASIFCVAAAHQNLKSLQKCFDALAWGLIPSLVVGICQFFGYQPVRAVTEHVPGLFLSSNTMATIAVVSMIGSIAYRRYWHAIPGTALVFMNQSREAYVALVLICLTASIRFLPNQKILRLLSLGGGFLFLILLTISVLWLDLNYGHGRMTSVNDRLVFWQLGLANITPTGWGLGSSVEIWPQFEHFHNEFIEYMFELGFGAFAILGIIVYALTSESPAKWPLLTLLFTCLFNFNLHEPMGAFLFSLLTGHLIGDRDRSLGFQSVRRVLTWPDPAHREDVGVGAIFAPDLRRVMVSSGSQYPRYTRDFPQPV